MATQRRGELQPFKTQLPMNDECRALKQEMAKEIKVPTGKDLWIPSPKPMARRAREWSAVSVLCALMPSHRQLFSNTFLLQEPLPSVQLHINVFWFPDCLSFLFSWTPELVSLNGLALWHSTLSCLYWRMARVPNAPLPI